MEYHEEFRSNDLEILTPSFKITFENGEPGFDNSLPNPICSLQRIYPFPE